MTDERINGGGNDRGLNKKNIDGNKGGNGVKSLEREQTITETLFDYSRILRTHSKLMCQ